MFKIEKGVPIKSSRSDYPFDDMEVGDSFAVPVTSESPTAVKNRLSAACAYHQRKLAPRKFIVRVEVGSRKVRVWRTA